MSWEDHLSMEHGTLNSARGRRVNQRVPSISSHSLLTKPGGRQGWHRKWELTCLRSLLDMKGRGLEFRSYNLLS